MGLRRMALGLLILVVLVAANLASLREGLSATLIPAPGSPPDVLVRIGPDHGTARVKWRLPNQRREE
jgi:hypothetical protein